MGPEDIEIGTPADGGEPVAGSTPINTGFRANVEKQAIGNGTIRLAAGNAIALPSIPSEAQSALIMLEAAPDAPDKTAALGRIWLNGTWPSEVQGLGMYHGAVIEVTCKSDLNRARIFSTDGKNHLLNVQYFNV